MKIKKIILPVLTILLFASGLFYMQDGSRVTGVPQAVEKNLVVALERMETVIEGSLSLVTNGDFSIVQGSDFALYLYEDLDLIGWSDKSFVPASSQVDEAFEVKLLKVGQGDFLVRKWKLTPQHF